MVLLNPTVLLGLLAASIPILIHLLNFRKLKKVEFSTLTFLKELQKSKIKKIKIKQWLLLALRTLIIIFLVLAFARPTLENVNFAGTASAAKSSIAFVLDNSLSMSYLTEKGSNFNRSKKIIKDILKQFDDGNEFYFVTTSDSVKETSNKQNAEQILDDIKITQIVNPTSSAIEKAKDILTKSQNINKEIYVISDFQESTFLHKDTIMSDSNENIKLYYFDLSINQPENYSVSNLKLKSSIIEINKPLSFSVNVSNFSANPQSNLSVSLYLNNERVAQQNVSLQPVQIKTVEFESTLKNTGLIEARAELEDDNILDDNICYLDFNAPEKIGVLLLADVINDLNFLDAALNAATNSGRIIVSKKSVSDISFVNLNNFDVVILVTSGNVDSKPISNYINSGGRLILFPNNSVDISKLNNLLNNLNLPKVQKIIKTENTNLDYAEFGKIDMNNPLFKNIFTNTKRQQIESPNIIKYLNFSKSQNLRPIIQLNDNSLFLGKTDFNTSKVLLFGISPDLNSGNFPFKNIFSPLITRSVLYLTSNQEILNYLVGENIPLKISNYNFPIIDVDFPGGNEKINLQNVNAKYFDFENDLIAGSYKFSANNKLINFAGVNINPIESDLKKIEGDSLNVYFTKLFGNQYMTLNSNENYLQRITQARYGTELWKLFLLLAFLLALIEMFIARSTKKDLLNVSQN